MTLGITRISRVCSAQGRRAAVSPAKTRRYLKTGRDPRGRWNSPSGMRLETRKNSDS